MRVALPRSPRIWIPLAAGIVTLTAAAGALLAPSRPGLRHAAEALDSLRGGRIREALERLAPAEGAAGCRVWQEVWGLLSDRIEPGLDAGELRAAARLFQGAVASGADLGVPPHVLAARLRHALLVREGPERLWLRLSEIFSGAARERDPELAWEGVATAALAGRWAEAAALYLRARTEDRPASSRAHLVCWPDPALARDALWSFRLARGLRGAAVALSADRGRAMEEGRAEVARRIAALARAGDPERVSQAFYLAGVRALRDGLPGEAIPRLERALAEAGSFYGAGGDAEYLPSDRAGLEICYALARALAAEARRVDPARSPSPLPEGLRASGLAELALLHARLGLPEGIERVLGVLPATGGGPRMDAARALARALGRALAGESVAPGELQALMGRLPDLPRDLRGADPIARPEAGDPDAPLADAVRIGRLCEELEVPEAAGPVIARLQDPSGAAGSWDREAVRLYVEALVLAARSDARSACAVLRRLLDLRGLRGGLPRALDLRDVAERLAALRAREDREEAAAAMRRRAARYLAWIAEAGADRGGAEGLAALARATLSELGEGAHADPLPAARAIEAVPAPGYRVDRIWVTLAGELEDRVSRSAVEGGFEAGARALEALRVLAHDADGSAFLLEEGRLARSEALRRDPRDPATRALWARAGRALARYAQGPGNGFFSYDAGEALFMARRFEEATQAFREYMQDEGLPESAELRRPGDADHRLFTSAYLLGVCALRLGRPRDALAALDAMAGDPDGASILGRRALYVRGMAYVALGRLDDAERVLRRLVATGEDERSPRWRRALLRLGSIALERASRLERDPASAPAARRAAYVSALRPLERVLDLLGDDEDPPLELLAETARLLEEGDADLPTGLGAALLAAEAAEGLARVDPDGRRAWIERAGRRFRDAASRYERLGASGRPAAAWIRRRALLGAGDAAFELGDREGARAAYEGARACDLRPAEELWVLYRLGECARGLGLPAAARRYLESGARLLEAGAVRGPEFALLPGPGPEADRVRFWRERIGECLAALP